MSGSRLVRAWQSLWAPAALSAIWLLLSGAYALGFVFGGTESPNLFEAALLVMAGVLPLVAIWSVAAVARALATAEARFDRLETGMETLLEAIEAQSAPSAQPKARPEPPAQTPPPWAEALGAQLHQLAQRVAAQETARHPEAAAPASPQASGGPAPPAQAPGPDTPLSASELITALNFPADARDRSGFAALKKALREPDLAQLLQAAEDVLNALAEVGLYMDDLTPIAAPPALWRRFAAGVRGAAVAQVGGIQDAEAEALIKARMDEDPVFRDAGLHFQRRFDAVLGGVAESVDDAQLIAFADTRTGRAFQLLARASGSFGAAKTPP